jgi:hypothetical protein
MAIEDCEAELASSQSSLQRDMIHRGPAESLQQIHALPVLAIFFWRKSIMIGR